MVTNPAPGGGSSSSVNFTISAPGTPQASLTPSTLAFPVTNVATTSAAQTVTLSNAGSAALSISAIAITGADASNFAQTNTCGSSLAAGSHCSIAVTFTPASAATFNAALTVTDNATGSPQQVTLNGTGVIPAAPIASLTPTSLSFSAVVGTSSASQTATLANTGNSPLSISGIALGGASANDYSQTNTCGSSLAAGSSCSIAITFAPISAGSLSATLSVADNAAGSPQTVSLTGTAAAAPSFTVSSTTATQTILPGSTAQYSINVAAQNGTFANPVTLSASGLPPGATATFAPSSITPGSSSAISQLTIQTAATAAVLSPERSPHGPDRGSGLRLAVLLTPLFGFFFAVRRVRKSWISMLILLLTCAGAATTLTGCGGGFSLPGSGVKTYTVTVTGTSGAVQQSTTVQLIVK